MKFRYDFMKSRKCNVLILSQTLFIVASILHLSGCKSKQEKATSAFTALIQQLEPSEFPISIKACDFRTTGLKPYKEATNTNYTMDPDFGICSVASNENYVATITFTRVECLIPYLTTYTLSGELIDKVCITSGRCGHDCGYTCEEGTIINEDLSFIIADSITVMDCDSIVMDLSPRPKSYVEYQVGKITPDGHIELSEEMRKPWKKSN